jgi:hypothetical protein
MREKDVFPELWTDSGFAGPQKKRRRKTPKKDLEGAVQKECLDWLVAHPDVLYVERRNTGAVKTEDGGFFRYGRTGGADIFCRLKRRPCDNLAYPFPIPVEIECKRRDGKGTLSDDQKTFKREMDDIGVPYIMVLSAEDMAEQLRELGLTD